MLGEKQNRKKSNYFSHDSNARTDEKILSVRIKHGIEGYGIYFMILENLREQADYSCIKDYNVLAFDIRTDASKIKSIVEDFGLFTFTEDGKRFYSESFNERMAHKDEKSVKAKESAMKRWQNHADVSKNNADVMRTHEKTDASKVKESKGNKEYKEEPVFTEEEQTRFKNFQAWVKENAPRINQLKKPLQISEFITLRKTISSETLKEICLAMENKADLLKKYTSAHLTINSWAKNRKTDTAAPVAEQPQEMDDLMKVIFHRK